jgi:hypothetical protein
VNRQDSSERTEADGQIEAGDQRRRRVKSDRDRLIDVVLLVFGVLLSIWWKSMRLSLVVLLAGIVLVAVAGARAWIHFQERPRSIFRRRS